ncbi:unnamed protein product [Menidia menidia]|uniref:(Atlantic silverside) hypothetical protein n=1 Tax=Menidia menidia TaxID=238744 RepID=A0A8S4B8M8_9TELE|nr:unnamed protein product [Menidia menidia]
MLLCLGICLGLLTPVHSAPVDNSSHIPVTPVDFINEAVKDGFLLPNALFPSLTTKEPTRNTTDNQPSTDKQNSTHIPVTPVDFINEAVKDGFLLPNALFPSLTTKEPTRNTTDKQPSTDKQIPVTPVDYIQEAILLPDALFPPPQSHEESSITPTPESFLTSTTDGSGDFWSDLTTDLESGVSTTLSVSPTESSTSTEVSSPSQTPDLLTSTLLMDGSGDSWFEMKDSTSSSISPAQSPTSTDESIINEDLFPLTTEPPKASSTFTVEGSGDYMFDFTSEAGSGHEGSAGSSLAVSKEAGNVLGAAPPRARPWVNVLHNDVENSENISPEQHRGHSTPDWIIIVGFIVGLAALIMLFPVTPVDYIQEANQRGILPPDALFPSPQSHEESSITPTPESFLTSMEDGSGDFWSDLTTNLESGVSTTLSISPTQSSTFTEESPEVPEVSSPSQTPDLLTSTLLMDGSGDSWFEMEDSTSSSISPPQSPTSTDESIINEDPSPFTTEPPKASTPFMVDGSGDYMFDFTSEAGSGHEGSAGSSLAVSEEAGNVLGAAPPRARPWVNVLHNDVENSENISPEQHRGHSTPDWIIIVGFIVGLAALIMLCAAIATRDKADQHLDPEGCSWNPPVWLIYQYVIMRAIKTVEMLALSGSGCQDETHEVTEEQDKEHPRFLIPELCRLFYQLGWVTGTGGGISLRRGEHIYIAPSGVQKERIQPDDMFVCDMEERDVSCPPAWKKLKKSQCTPLFMNAFTLREARAVIHTHSKAAVMATLLFPGAEFRITHQEMIKGIRRGTSGSNYRYAG